MRQGRKIVEVAPRAHARGAETETFDPRVPRPPLRSHLPATWKCNVSLRLRPMIWGPRAQVQRSATGTAIGEGVAAIGKGVAAARIGEGVAERQRIVNSVAV